MFLATEKLEAREQRVWAHFLRDGSVGLLVAAVNFEWTVTRAILFLSQTPTSELRAKMRNYYTLDKYKLLWKEEVSVHLAGKLLPSVVKNWCAVRTAFDERGRLAHGRSRYTRNMAQPHVEALMAGARFVYEYCEALGMPLSDRMPVRRQRSR